MKEIKVSVIIATYNSNWEKLTRTIDSVIGQKKVCVEVLIADDGSRIDLEEQICDYFTRKEFDKYCYIKAEKNRGTVLNYFNACQKAMYPWVKFLSPGDMLFDDMALYNWIMAMMDADAEISFGRSIYYNQDGEIKELIEYPINKELFCNNTYSGKNAFLDYVFLRDVPNGASFIGTKSLYTKYLARIAGKIKFAEDMIYRMMLSEEIKILYYYDNVIWYEYGEGISTGGSSKWKDIIDHERVVCNKLIEKNEMKSALINKRVQLSLKLPVRFDCLKYLLNPALIKLKLMKNREVSYTSKNELLEQRLTERYK